MPEQEDSNKEDDRRAVAVAVANLVLALHFGLLTFLCDNLFKKGVSSREDFDQAAFMRLYRCVAHTLAILWTFRGPIQQKTFGSSFSLKNGFIIPTESFLDNPFWCRECQAET